MIKELLIRGMQLGVGITAFVGVTSALSTLPGIGNAIGTGSRRRTITI